MTEEELRMIETALIDEWSKCLEQGQEEAVKRLRKLVLKIEKEIDEIENGIDATIVIGGE